jgi:hypothetical protein
MKADLVKQPSNYHFSFWTSDEETVHKGNRSYSCPYDGCDGAFGQRSNLNKHMRVVRTYQLRLPEDWFSERTSVV